MRLKLLEANPTPSLAEIGTSAKRFRAISQSNIPSFIFAAKPAVGVSVEQLARKFDILQDTLMQLTAAVSALMDRYEHLAAVMSAPLPQLASQRWQDSAGDGFQTQARPKNRPRSNQSHPCFTCNGLGNFVRFSPYAAQCTLCLG